MGTDVLAFYRDLPFNFYASPDAHTVELRRVDPLQAYPPLAQVLGTHLRLLDVGCGTGWLVNAAAFHHKCAAIGVDFNPVAIEQARSVANLLSIDSTFVISNLFSYSPTEKFDLVTSVGVLHHTDNCRRGIERVASLVNEQGRMFVGLYHLFGRQPFLSHFNQMRQRGASEENLYGEFRRLRAGSGARDDESSMRSWFRDQVLHPHETSHTLAEVLPIIENLGFVLESTSINHFAPVPEHPGVLFEQEKKLKDKAQHALAEGRLFPGFFVFMARRRAKF